jgi:NAD(P)-dependent dehydrogenase (short-subunit alcohol dehydrogenase family)
MLTMLYARENEGIHFAAVAPGLVDTAMQDYLCGHEPDTRFPSLESLKSRRGSSDMPNPSEASKKLVSLFDCVEKHVESGGFVDIRHLPEFV